MKRAALVAAALLAACASGPPPATHLPTARTVLVPFSDDGWDRAACERLLLDLAGLEVYPGTFETATHELRGTRMLVVDMTPDPNHDTLQVFFIDERGSRAWAEKASFGSATLNPEHQTANLADRMARKIAGRL